MEGCIGFANSSDDGTVVAVYGLHWPLKQKKEMVILQYMWVY